MHKWRCHRETKRSSFALASYGGQVEEIKRLDALLEYAVMHDDEAEAARRADETGGEGVACRKLCEEIPSEMTDEECPRSQIVTLNGGRGSNLKYLPYAFTERGVGHDDGTKTLLRNVSRLEP